MNSGILIAVVVTVIISVHYTSSQPLCSEADPLTNKLCLSVVEELLRRSHSNPEPEYEPPRNRIAGDLFENNLPFERGAKRQDVDHVFLRFGR